MRSANDRDRAPGGLGAPTVTDRAARSTEATTPAAACTATHGTALTGSVDIASIAASACAHGSSAETRPGADGAA